MKRQIISTIILLIATVAITVLYFKNLNPPGANTSRVMAAIPDGASVIFQFTNEKSFYDIFGDDSLISNVIGQQKLNDIDALRICLLDNPLLNKYFEGQSLFISLHALKNKDVDLLLTIQAVKGFDLSGIGQLANEQNTGLIINPVRLSGIQGYEIYINSLKKKFYLVNKGNGILSGTFSQELAQQCAANKTKNDLHKFVMLSEHQTTNSLATIYLNNMQFTSLFGTLFNDGNTDILKSFRQLPAHGALSLNYRTDALMFSGNSSIEPDQPASYLSLFADQQPVVNHLKDIFPATTAYSTNFSVSNPSKFTDDLYSFHNKGGIKQEQDSLFKKIKAETGVNLRSEFNSLLGNEFAIVTTRFQERYAIISVKDGAKLSPLMMDISTMATDKMGQFNYSKLPFYLLGDAFSILKKPWFIIADNYLVLATSQNELMSYYDTYLNRKFLSKMLQYNQFDNLLSERSNVAFYINFKNAGPILKSALTPAFYTAFSTNNPGWKNFYGASFQYSAADHDFYTNLCIRLNNIDTAATDHLP